MSKGLCRYGVTILGELYALCTYQEGHTTDARNVGTVMMKDGHRLMDVRGHYVNAPYWCAHCGRPMGNMEGGYATITAEWPPSPSGPGLKRVCHPNVPGRPDCYRLITIYHEVLGVRLNETQVGYQKIKAAQSFLQRTLMQ